MIIKLKYFSSLKINRYNRENFIDHARLRAHERLHFSRTSTYFHKSRTSTYFHVLPRSTYFHLLLILKKCVKHYTYDCNFLAYSLKKQTKNIYTALYSTTILPRTVATTCCCIFACGCIFRVLPQTRTSTYFHVLPSTS